jgi:hypothetical protein
MAANPGNRRQPCLPRQVFPLVQKEQLNALATKISAG